VYKIVKVIECLADKVIFTYTIIPIYNYIEQIISMQVGPNKVNKKYILFLVDIFLRVNIAKHKYATYC